MPTCMVPGCTSGYFSNPEKVHFFTIPKDPETAEKWKSAVKRGGDSIKIGRVACEKHFVKDDILWQRELLGPDGRVLGVSQYKIPRLRKGTVPTQFAWNDWTERTEPVETEQMKPLVEGVQSEKSSAPDAAVDAPPPNNDDCRTSIADEIVFEEPDLRSIESTSLAPTEQPVEMQVLDFKAVATDFDLPPGWLKQITGCPGTQLIFFFIHKTEEIGGSYETFILKDVTVTENLSIQVRVLGKRLDLRRFNIICPITAVHQLQNFLVELHRLNVCRGCWAPPVKPEIEQLNYEKIQKDLSATWRHVECPLLLADKKICEDCSKAKNTVDKNLRRYIQGKVRDQRNKKVNSREQKKHLLKMQSKYRSVTRIKRLVKQKVKSLKQEVFEMREKMANCTSRNIEQSIESGKVSQNQVHVLNQIIEAAKRKNSKGRNYSEEWMLLCMLLHMRSPAGYEFLRCNEILPVPSVRTVRRYLSNIKTGCGFDSEFFQVFKVALAKMEESQRHGILLLDEISTRESVTVNTKQLTYKGLIDFGEEGPKSSSFTKKANHVLVLMFQPLNAGHPQTIAVFASRGPVAGEVLAQLIVKAIVLLEGIGAKIHAVVSDGASANRKFWSLVDVSGAKDSLKNYFEHPVVQGRKIFIFSDTPHLMKTIRNRLHNNGVLQMDPAESVIKWEYIRLLHEKDREHAGPGQALVCPKLSANHVNLNNSLKMRVRLATQVFSNSVAGGLRFFEKYVPELDGCEATASFCKWMNDMFDALNRKHPIDGVQVGNRDFKVIQESLRRLDSWEDHVQNGRLSKEMFLTKQTAEGLRVTLQSMLDLVEYLTQQCGFQYVLTGRVNQDPLEKNAAVLYTHQC